jgi:hypothetical protein
VWSTEREFIAQRPPRLIEELAVCDAAEAIPSDFASWVKRETTSHVEMLRAFAQRRRQRPELRSAAARLAEELEAFEPGALGRCRAEAESLPARRRFFEFRSSKRVEREVPASAPLSWGIARRFLTQAALLGGLYGLYRLVRPAGPSTGFQASLGTFSFRTTLDTLMWIYGNAHVIVAFSFLAWVFFKHHGAFEFVRNAVIGAAVAAVVPYLLFSSGGAYGPHQDLDVPSSAIPTIPALHLSIAIVVGCWGILLSRGMPARLMWITYPFLALVVVIISGPNNLVVSIASGVIAAIVGFLAAILAGYLHRSWGLPHLRGLRLSRLPTILHY